MMTSRQQVSGRTVKERLLNDITDDYEPDVDPGAVDLQMSISLLCSYQEEDTGFIVSHGWEFYVSTPIISYSIRVTQNSLRVTTRINLF